MTASSLSTISLMLDDPRWVEFVAAHADALPFHHPAWAALLARCYGFRAFALALVDGDARLAAGLPIVEVAMPLRGRRWVSLPFTDVCPPLLSPAASTAELVAHLDRARSQASVRQVEVRDDVDGPRAHRRTCGVIHRLALSGDFDAVFAGFARKRIHSDIRKAKRHGVELRQGVSRADVVDVFYGLHAETRRRQGVPVQPRRYFSLLWEHLVRPGLGFVAVASAAGKPVAAAVFLAWNGTIVYKYGASDPDHWHLRPNHLLFGEVIRWACTNGFHTFDFGRTDLSNAGLRAFKSGWGATETALTYSVVAERPPASSNSRLAGALQPVIRRSPLWVSRALGELLYRYAA